jgi:branched-chain amino acid transport system substrate-binding protein
VKLALKLLQGKVDGRPIQLKVIDVQSTSDARAAVDELVDRYHVPLIIGSQVSALSVAAATEADKRKVVFWETGAVADEVTLNRSWVFRTVATGDTLGRTAGDFTADTLIPQLGESPGGARVVIAHVNDSYGNSVAAGEVDRARAHGLVVVDDIPYNPSAFDTVALVAQIKADRPDYFWDVSYVADGVAIWREVVSQAVSLRAAVGTSSAFCTPEFGQQLGPLAVGVFAADKPDQTISPSALSPAAKVLLQNALAEYGHQAPGAPMTIAVMAGFVGGWVLFHDTLPSITGPVIATSIRAAADAVDLPAGQEINGAGVYFARPGSSDAGQNLRAAADVSEWTGVNQMQAVYPSGYATAVPLFVGPPGSGGTGRTGSP